MELLDFAIRIHMERASHVGTGLGRGLVDRTTRRDARGNVYIPASTIKGRLRDACEHVVRLYSNQDNGLRACHPPNPANMCRGKDTCIVCRLFGSAYVGERLFFEDGVLTAEIVKAYTESYQSSPRTRVKLDPRWGTAARGHLFTTEYVEPNLTFAARVSGRLPLTSFEGKPAHAYELVLLAAGVRMVKELGGDKSAGFGLCEMSFEGPLRIGQDSVDYDELTALVDCLELYGIE
jgi:CRISPR/Cas system CSM-associated protein Csm3 (group 7 of RAMP superfamily)